MAAAFPSGLIGRRKLQWARTRDVLVWAAVSAVIAGIMLSGVAALGAVFPGSPYAGAHSGLFDRHHDLGDMLRILGRNASVLGLHLGACWVGAIVARPHVPAPARWGAVGRLHRPLPAWVARTSLLYATTLTLASVALQTTGLSLTMADLSAAAHVSSATLTALVLPHAIIELIGVFLPLGLFLIAAQRRQLDRLSRWSVQAGLIGLAMITVAAAIEVWATPHLVRGVIL